MPFGGRSVGALARGLIGLGAIALIFLFLARSLASNWNDLRSEEIDIQPVILLLSILPALAALLVLSLIWTRIVGYLTGESRLPLGKLTKVFFYSWIGRYVPGKVAYVLGRFYLGRSIGLPSTALVGSIAYENVLLVATASAFATVMLVPVLAFQSENFLPYLALPAIALAGVIALHPRVLGRVLPVVLRLVGRESTEVDWLLPVPEMAKLAALYFVHFSLNGLGFYLLIVSLTSYSPGHLPFAMGAYTLAGVIGLISLFAPAGLGVREGVLVAVLQFTMPVEVAILVALAARVWATVIDLLLVGGCFAVDYASGDRILFAALRGRRSAELSGGPSDALDP